MQLVRLRTMRSNAGGPQPDHGLEGGMGVSDSAEAPVTLKVDFWTDREPDVSFEPLPPWLAAAVLQRASELAYDMAEVEWEEAHTQEEDEE